MTTPSGDDWLTANQLRAQEGMEEVTSSSHLTPLPKSDTMRGKAMPSSWQRPNGGRARSTQMKAAKAAGHTVGGSPADRYDLAKGCLVLLGVAVLISLLVLCWVCLYFIILHSL